MQESFEHFSGGDPGNEERSAERIEEKEAEMATQIKLKKRPAGDELTVSMKFIKEVLSSSEASAKERLYIFFESLKDSETEIHDKKWLEAIVNWEPKGGIPLTEEAKWMKLALRVGELDDEDDSERLLTLSNFQTQLIIERLKHNEYRAPSKSMAWRRFLMDFMEASGMQFKEWEPEAEEKEEEEDDDHS
ncbi:hypothetical protein IID24_01695 [Patescibacteria group bacterium]|nr:hypothetical protein [Patescibacteria group bacterium]